MSETRETRLSRKTRETLALVREHGIAYTNDADRYAPVTGGKTQLVDGQPWVNFRTAYAIERAGLGRVEGFGEDTELVVWGEQSG